MLGECLHAIQNPQVYRAELYVKEVGNFFTLLERTRLRSTRRLADSLAGVAIPNNHVGMIMPIAGSQLASLAHPIATRLYEEANERTFVESDANVSASIVSFSQQWGRTLEPHQEALRGDAELCLRARLYRPAIVSAWNLCIDLIRWWLFSDSQRLNDFNSLLQQRTANHRGGPRSIGRYEDFFLSQTHSCCKSVAMPPGRWQPSLLRPIAGLSDCWTTVTLSRTQIFTKLWK